MRCLYRMLVRWMYAKFLYTYIQIRERGTFTCWPIRLPLSPPHPPLPVTALLSPNISQILHSIHPPAAVLEGSVLSLGSSKTAAGLCGRWSQEAQWGEVKGGREEGPRGWIREQVILWAQPCWRPSEKVLGCPSEGSWVFTYSLPSLPGWEFPLGY